MSLWSNLFQEGALVIAGRALKAGLAVVDERRALARTALDKRPPRSGFIMVSHRRATAPGTGQDASSTPLR